jgi:hypothetical protein
VREGVVVADFPRSINIWKFDDVRRRHTKSLSRASFARLRPGKNAPRL